MVAETYHEALFQLHSTHLVHLSRWLGSLSFFPYFSLLLWGIQYSYALLPLPLLVIPFLFLLLFLPVLGSNSNRGQNPGEWDEIPSICTYFCIAEQPPG